MKFWFPLLMFVAAAVAFFGVPWLGVTVTVASAFCAVICAFVAVSLLLDWAKAPTADEDCDDEEDEDAEDDEEPEEPEDDCDDEPDFDPGRPARYRMTFDVPLRLTVSEAGAHWEARGLGLEGHGETAGEALVALQEDAQARMEQALESGALRAALTKEET